MTADAAALLAHWFDSSPADDNGSAVRRYVRRLVGAHDRVGILPADDAVLLHRLRTGDDRAFEEWYLRDYAVVRAFAARFAPSDDAADDLTQEVFSAVWYRRTTLDIQIGLRTYLLAAVRHRALNLARRDHIAADIATPDDVPFLAQPTPAPDAAVEASDTIRALRRAIAQLPERQRSALVLRLEQSLPNVEIARILGVGEAAVSRLLSRAIEALRTAMPKP